jgi:predicted small lipoprotein YifL
MFRLTGESHVTLRPLLCALGLLSLAACGASGPGQIPGVGDYAAYQAQREATLIGNAQPIGLPQAPAVSASALPPQPGAIPATDLAAAGIGLGAPLSATVPGAMPAPGGDPLRTAGVQASPANAALPQAGGIGISDEQDFDAVSNRESIETAAARRASQAAQYQVVQPTALPTPPADTGPNIVSYALSAPNRVGQPWYSRFVWAGARYDRNCGRFRSADEAQAEFLRRGGPERDPLGIDPDGDGFACRWDPAPFLAAVGRS